MKEEATTLPQQFIKKYRLLLGEEASDFFSALEQGSVKKNRMLLRLKEDDIF